VQANLFDVDLDAEGPFDLILCLGLMYHVSKTMSLMEVMAGCNTDVIVIDTTLSMAHGSQLELRRGSMEEPRHAVDYELVAVPTQDAVAALAGQFGYSVAILRPAFNSYEGGKDYESGHRRASSAHGTPRWMTSRLRSRSSYPRARP
jgi:hypothetical protein